MRKWTYLMVALLLGGSAVTFTGCVDNDEPLGVESMRTAKAEFYRAQAAVKTAEVAYQNALAEFELQLVEEMKLKNKALELANELQAANNEKDKAVLQAAIEELKAQHEVKMQQIAADKAVADAAYETALKDLALTVSAINGEYTAEYSRLLAKITDNRAKYNMKAANVTELQLQLMSNTLSKLDTAAMRLQLNAEIKKHQTQLDYLEKQKAILEEVSAPAVSTETEMAALDKQIRELVNTYNAAVVTYKSLDERKTKENNAVTAFENKHAADNKVKWEATASANFTVPANIQHEFITTMRIDPKGGLVNTIKVNGNDRYSLAESNYTEKVVKADIGMGSSSYNTTTELTSQLNIIQSMVEYMQQDFYNGANINPVDKNAFDLAYAKLPSYQNALANLKATYDADKTAWAAANTAYFSAHSTYMHESNETYYQYVTRYKRDVYDPAITAAGADADKKTAAQEAFLPILKAYAEARQGLDGWAYATSATEEPLYKTLKAADIDARYTQILGAATLNTGTTKPAYKDAKTYDEYPYGVFAKASNVAFGIQELMNAPVDEDELFATSQSWGGSYAKYFAQLQQINNLEKAKASNDLLAEVIAAATEPTNTTITWAREEISYEEELAKLNAIVDATQAEMTALQNEIGNSLESLSVVYQEGSESVTPEQGTTEPLKGKLITVQNLGYYQGTQGNYISALVSIHNNLAQGLTDYSTELAAIEEDITAVTKVLSEAKGNLEKFENGGYTITTPGDLSVTVAKGITISISNSGSGKSTYGDITITVTRPNTTGGDNSGSSTPNGNDDSYTSSSITLKYGDPRYKAAFDALQEGETVTINVSFLKSWIEGKEAQIQQLRDQMEDLNKELPYLQKELNAFVTVIAARYPAQ